MRDVYPKPKRYSAGVLLVDTPQRSGDEIERDSVKIESLRDCAFDKLGGKHKVLGLFVGSYSATIRR